MAEQIAIGDFQRVEMRVGVITAAEDFPKARKPSYRLTIDLGPTGVRRSVAALKTDYRLEDLPGRQVVCVVNFPPRRIAGFDSEVLVLAATHEDGALRLLSPAPAAELGSLITEPALEVQPGEVPRRVGARPLEGDALRLQPASHLRRPARPAAGRDPARREEDPVGVGEQAAGRGAADHAGAAAAQRHPRDLAVGGPLAPPDQGGDPRYPAVWGSTHTLAAVSRPSASSRPEASSRRVPATRSSSWTRSRVPGTRLRSRR